MKPTQSLPEAYQQDSIVDLSKDKKLAINLNIIGVVVFFVSGVFFMGLALILRGEEEISFTFDNILLALLGAVLVVFLMIVVHEGIHGICFWYLTGGKPKFGFKCLMCMRCIYNCPEKAISPRFSKFIPIRKGYSLKKFRP